MSESLVQIGQQALQQEGGNGIDFGSKLFRLKPATITINQPNTQAEGAIRGNLRISETGDQFEQMTVALLVMPVEQRSFYVGEKGGLNRTQDNLMCFSRDLFKPDAKAKVPQSLRCDGCPKADWTKWRETKRKEDIPPCDSYYYAVFIDTVYKMPLQMFIRSKSKAPFEVGTQNLARNLSKMKAAGRNPNIYDLKFTLSTELIKTGNLPSYVLKMSDFAPITEEERAQFGELFMSYVNGGKRADDKAAEQEAASQILDAEEVIEGELVESPAPAGGEITI